MKAQVRKVASMLRWRLVPVRYATMVGTLNWSKLFRDPPPRNATIERVLNTGSATGPNIPSDVLEEMRALYMPRALAAKAPTRGHPFVNLFSTEDIRPDNPVFRFAFSPEVLDQAADYFGGRLILDSIQVLYSFPTEGAPRESQYWHLDYGDSKSFHCVAYLNDVLTPEDGPFVYVDKQSSDAIGRSIIVRRIADDQFAKEHRNGELQYFYGKAGESVFVDPAACYHYGSRCRTPRLAIFVTFNTWFPFAQPVPLVVEQRKEIYQAARQLRPDLADAFLKALLKID